MLNKKYQVLVDRSVGYQDSFGTIYPINYGYIPGLLAGDGEEQDAYIISDSVNGPLSTFEGKLAAIIHRRDDVEDKFVITSQDEMLTKEGVQEATHFLEQYFDSWIELI